ncbi:TIGR03086 family metal-binding protein [Streptomyces indicus]|uniref:TIGR03086 family protein n=1 Tax=Streptomyces indicus TaxID=417292 RepID=A0A1G9FFB4_9ACTN|nr:TIGR03086 family metal-binding protein [Streptomyces indicus]SDK87068.1 TIGR03086 family protein [Streptomyces indicus]
MSPIDFRAQTRLVTELADRVTDAQLDLPTPCPALAVRNLLGHIVGLAAAFRDAARKEFGPAADSAPDVEGSDIGPGWRAELAKNLAELAESWQDPAAWEGFTKAGGVDLPAAVAGQVAMNELVLHGWDLARATGQAYDPDPACLKVSYDMVAATPDGPEREGLFGPIVPVPATASLLDRTLGLGGRDPGWVAH